MGGVGFIGDLQRLRSPSASPGCLNGRPDGGPARCLEPPRLGPCRAAAEAARWNLPTDELRERSQEIGARVVADRRRSDCAPLAEHERDPPNRAPTAPSPVPDDDLGGDLAHARGQRASVCAAINEHPHQYQRWRVLDSQSTLESAVARPAEYAQYEAGDLALQASVLAHGISWATTNASHSSPGSHSSSSTANRSTAADSELTDWIIELRAGLTPRASPK